MADKIDIKVTVNGKEVPLSTISTETFEKIKAKENPLTAGDIVKSETGGKRIIVSIVNTLYSIDRYGTVAACEKDSYWKKYKKIGRLENTL